jgi:MFS family permease
MANDAPGTAPPLWPALAAMTGLQALVSLALFAPGVLAPKTGLSEGALALFATTVFAVGTVTSFWGGALADRFGSFRVASLCALVTAAGMLVFVAGSGAVAAVVAGVLVGLAFGPETPASAALLNRLSTEANRPFVFSVRQTGNQLGAMLGSVSLPLIAALAVPQAGFLAIAALAIIAVVIYERLRPTYDANAHEAWQPASLVGALRLLRVEPALGRLALVAMPYMAMQASLNTFFVSYAVRELGLALTTAGAILAVAQGGGLVGRAGFGFIVSKGLSARTFLIAAGVGMALAAIAMVLVASRAPVWLLVPLMALFGLTASGWNGVFVAEVARLAPAGRTGEATGAVLFAGYFGLVVGPLVVAAAANLGGLGTSYLVLAALALIGAAILASSRS